MKNLFLGTLGVIFFSSAAFAQACPGKITAKDIEAAQDAWANAIVAMGASDNPKKIAEATLGTLYGYADGPVLFKPTKAAKTQFRLDKESALSYFVGGSVPEDKGFALAPYTSVRFDNKSITADCDSALAMGNYYFTDISGGETKVEYTFGYFRDASGTVKINLHHSSLPYTVH